MWNLYLKVRQRQININQINNILFLIKYNASKKFYLKYSQKMTILDKKFSNFLI